MFFKGSRVRSVRFTDVVGNLTSITSYVNNIFTPLIYTFRYDVVRKALVGFLQQKIAAKFRRQQPTPANN